MSNLFLRYKPATAGMATSGSSWLLPQPRDDGD